MSRRSAYLSLILIMVISVFLLANGCSSPPDTRDSAIVAFTPTQNKALDGAGNPLPPFPVVSMTPDGTRTPTATKVNPRVTIIMTMTPRG